MRIHNKILGLIALGVTAVAALAGCEMNRLVGAPCILLESSRSTEPEAISLNGAPLTAPALPPEIQEKREAQLAAAQADYDRDPHDESAIVWLGRRLAYLGRYNQAIDAFSNGLAIYPESYKLLRHRGHRYITVRKFDLAAADLQRAAELIDSVPDEVEPDGQPNRLNIPTSTSHTNIFYHLGLAHYLQGDFTNAERAYRRCFEFSANDDMRVATVYWLFLTLRRLDRHDDALAILDMIQPEMNIIENTSYHRLMLVFQGELDSDQLVARDDENQSVDLATIGYGLGVRDLLHGENESAARQFRNVIAETNWAAFGHIAAEAELCRSSAAK